MKAGKIIVIIFFCSILCFLIAAEKKSKKVENMKLKITGFLEESSMKEAGAKIGDIIINYNGSNVHSLKDLAELKSAVETDKVKVDILRDRVVISLEIPKGQLGVYITELAPDHEIDKDAVIIDGIGKLGWGIGMENSFFGALALLEEKFGNGLSYNELVGLSGYGFRMHFFDGWCPSSPDATVGKNVGEEMMKALGYKFKSIHQDMEEFKDDKMNAYSREELQKEIVRSIDNGFPVIAIDLIEVPEWGLIAGYQKDGEELFCRTYFDKTEGYEIAEKSPWVIFIIEDFEEKNTDEFYRKLFPKAIEMMETEKYDEYFSGINAFKEWIKALEDEKSFSTADEKKLEEMKLANWWIYYSLMEARAINKEFLKKNSDKFKCNKETLSRIKDICGKQSELLYANLKKIPSPHDPTNSVEWNNENRKMQIEILQKILEQEMELKTLLKEI